MSIPNLKETKISIYRTINFKNKKFDSVIVLNSESEFSPQQIVDLKLIFEHINSTHIIVADGAFNKLVKLDIIPNTIIGDLDSINMDLYEQYAYTNPNLEIIKIEEQETNDFEKCLTYSLNKHFKNILVFGLHGGLLEHSLNNWSVLNKFSKRLNLCIYENNRYSFVIDEATQLHLDESEIVSLIPQTYLKVKTENLKWELNNEYLGLGYREGARNVVVKSPITISMDSGSLLFFCNARLPFCP